MTQQETGESGLENGLETLLTEDRRFPPSPEFAAQANATRDLYAWANADPEGSWAEQARLLLSWGTPFTQSLDWSEAPFARWFADGTLNACVNAVDRHVEAGNGDRVALHFEGEPGDTRTLTYADLLREVSRAANAMQALGVRTGDRVALELLASHRDGIEVMRSALRGYRSPYAHLLDALCRTLPPVDAATEERYQRLVTQGPPAEMVGTGPAFGPSLGDAVPFALPFALADGSTRS